MQVAPSHSPAESGFMVSHCAWSKGPVSDTALEPFRPSPALPAVLTCSFLGFYSYGGLSVLSTSLSRAPPAHPSPARSLVKRTHHPSELSYSDEPASSPAHGGGHDLSCTFSQSSLSRTCVS